MAKTLTWWQAAEVLGINDRQMPGRWRLYQEHDSDGVYDRRGGDPPGTGGRGRAHS